jgi:hypothetical protein
MYPVVRAIKGGQTAQSDVLDQELEGSTLEI